MTTVKVGLDTCIAPAFYGVHDAIWDKTHWEYLLKGGRGSTKSSFVSIEIVLGILSDPNAHAIIFRKYGNTIRDSVMSQMLWAIDKLGLPHLFTFTHAPAEITYVPTGQKIIMRGLDDPLKLKSIKRKSGYYKYLWFEELEEFGGMAEIRSVRQSILRGGDEFFVFMSYNPPNDPNAWVNKEAEAKVKGRLSHHSTYLDVPPEWLGQQFISDAETLKANDRLTYDHEYMGLSVGNANQIVFNGKWEELEFETPPARDCLQGRYFYGSDFGFAQDPTTIVRCFIRDNCLYVDHIAGGVGIEIVDTAKLYDTIPDIRRWRIYGDAARPETISHLKREGFNISSAPKWAGSVEEGIKFIRSFKRVYIHPRCKALVEEMRKYSYKVDRLSKEVLPVIADNQQDHYIDALRYALAEYIKRKVSILDVV